MFSPAHSTKHIPLLLYPLSTSTTNNSLHLIQSDNSTFNGTTLWLGAQCLSVYLAHYTSTQFEKPPKVVELGSGIGLTALVMSSLGWDVLATDTSHVISTVLAPNIQNNLPHLPLASGEIHVRELDWTIPPDQWTWDDNTSIASESSTSPSASKNNNKKPCIQPPFDLICSADTVYSSHLVQPLLRTLHTLCTLSLAASTVSRAPPVYLCIERRDPALVDRVLAEAHDIWNFTVERIPHRKLVKAMGKGGIKWPKEEWDDVEIWKFTLRRA